MTVPPKAAGSRRPVSIQAGRSRRPFPLSVVEILRPVKGPLGDSAPLRSSLAFGEPLTGLALRISFPAFSRAATKNRANQR
jgi:hypothetical protein